MNQTVSKILSDYSWKVNKMENSKLPPVFNKELQISFDLVIYMYDLFLFFFLQSSCHSFEKQSLNYGFCLS